MHSITNNNKNNNLRSYHEVRNIITTKGHIRHDREYDRFK